MAVYPAVVELANGCFRALNPVRQLASRPHTSTTVRTLCTAYPSQYSLAARQAGTVTNGQTQDQTGTGKRGA